MGILWAHTGAIGCIVIYVRTPPKSACNNQPTSFHTGPPAPPTHPGHVNDGGEIHEKVVGLLIEGSHLDRGEGVVAGGVGWVDQSALPSPKQSIGSHLHI